MFRLTAEDAAAIGAVSMVRRGAGGPAVPLRKGRFVRRGGGGLASGSLRPLVAAGPAAWRCGLEDGEPVGWIGAFRAAGDGDKEALLLCAEGVTLRLRVGEAAMVELDAAEGVRALEP